MSAQQKRPIFLTFYQMRFPITAIISILHRVSGLILFLLLPFFLAFFYGVLVAPDCLRHCLGQHGPWIHGALWLSLSVLGFHLIAGVRHLMMDFHVLSHGLFSGTCSSYAVLLLSLLLSVLMGCYLW